MLEKIIKWLQNPATYDFKSGEIKTIHTHISVVILTGDYAIKIKKPVNFGFLDFDSLSKRQVFCSDEIRLNSILSPDIYLKVIKIYYDKNNDSFNFDGNGEIVEYAVKMRRFSQQNLFSNLLDNNKINNDLIHKLSTKIGYFHLNGKNSADDFGTFENVSAPMLDNFITIKDLLDDKNDNKIIIELENLTKNELQKSKEIIKKRANNHKIKECHGDMHTNNIAIFNDELQIFDCIEFNPYFSNIDVINDFAFLYMDLQIKEKPVLASLLLNLYFNQTYDFEGLKLLKLYAGYRAVVRAKIATLTAGDSSISSAKKNELKQEYNKYINYALSQFNNTQQQNLIIMSGFSGTGKSKVSQILLKTGNFIRLQTDNHRKVLLKNTPKNELYSKENINKVYQSLIKITKQCYDAGFSVIIDGAFLKQSERDLFYNLSLQLKVKFKILSIVCNEETACKRITVRAKEQDNISDATCEVLKMQIKNYEDFNLQEKKFLTTIDAQKYDVVKIKEQLKKINCHNETGG
ncbi:MAG: hypothetical protein DRQ51_06275 [Gammaproteobacteria bacterium]|nr:MAG: hypothetical protein DRQ51_06275 [Gammaproteobacteria bacterium]